MKVVFSSSSILKTDSFIRRIYHNICTLIPSNIFFMKFIHWELKGNFKILDLVLMIFNKGSYLTFKAVFHKALN